MPRFWEVTWAQTYSTVLGRNVTEVEPTNLRQHQVYIEVGPSIIMSFISSQSSVKGLKIAPKMGLILSLDWKYPINIL